MTAAVLLGCTKTEGQPEKAEVAEKPDVVIEKAPVQPPVQPTKKVMNDDMYIERARKQLKPENMESELNRIEKELDLMERELEREEKRLDKGERKTP